MTEIEDRLRQGLNSHLDVIEGARSLPSAVKVRARRGRAVLIGLFMLGAGAVLTAVAGAVVSLGGDARQQLDVGPAVPTLPAFPVVPHENGRVAYSLSTGRGMVLHSMRPNGSSDRIVPTPPGEPWLHAWSPDGSKVALSIFPIGNGERTIWVMNADGSDAHEIATAENVSVPSWSPDGSTIAYSASAKGRTEIHLVGMDGTNDRTIHGEGAQGTFAIFSAKFSPDGRRILFDRGTDAGFDIFSMKVDGSDVQRLTATGTDYDPHWSPDGTQIAFTRQEIVEIDGQSRAASDIFVMNADGSDVRRLTDGGPYKTNLYPQWAPDETRIAYVAGVTGGPGALVIMNPDGSDPVELVPDDVLSISWQPLPVTGTPDEP